MFISRVTIHGFKSYDDTVVFGPFAQGKNALVGLNGSGKSNFYAAIGFVLLDEYDHIRITDRKALLHEGQGQSAMTAYVEIVFDNKSHKIPIDSEEVSIRRSIGLKKDEYFIDRKNSTRQDVHNLLESCGFSPSSGYYIVRQGKVNALALMKDSERLDLLYDIAGTKFYDQQREESLKMIQESNSRTKTINESLEYIKDRISQLEEDKEELEEYEKLDKEKRAVEYLIQNIEFSNIQEEIDENEEAKKSEAADAKSYQDDYDVTHKKLKESQDKLDELKARESQLKRKKEKAEKDKNDSIRDRTRTEVKIKGLRSKLANTESLKEKYTQDLENVESDIQANQKELDAVNEEFAEVSKQRGIIQGQLDALSQIISKKFQDPTSTENELDRAQKAYDRLVDQEKEIRASIDNSIEDLNKYKEKKQQLDDELSSQYADHASKKEERSAKMNDQKKLWHDEDQCLSEERKIEQKLDELHSKMNSAIPADLSSGIEAVKKMNMSGVYGPIYDLITCPKEVSIAVSAVGKGRLFCFITDDDSIGVKLIQELKDKNLGVASVLPLNIANKNKIKFPEGVKPLISQIEFDEKFTNAINLILGKTVLADSREEAISLVQKYNIDVVTNEGEFFSANGPITGGSKSHKRSPIYMKAEFEKYEQKKVENSSNLEEIRKKLIDVDKDIKALDKEISSSEDEKNKKREDRILTNVQISDTQEEIESKTNQLENLKNRIEEAQRYYLSVEKRLNYIKEFNQGSQDDESTRQQYSSCRHENDRLSVRRNDLYKQKIELSSALKDSLYPRRKRILTELDTLDSAKLAKDLEVLEKENEIADSNFTKTSEQIEDIDNELDEILQKISSTETEVAKLQKEEDTTQNNLNLKKNNMERIYSRISLLKQRQEECKKQEKENGALPEKEISEFEGQSMSELMRHLKNINQELQKFRHVNKKAIEQHKAFTQQEQELIKRQEELRASDESISKLIETLDARKEEALFHTFTQIKENFTNILKELEPNAKGELIPQVDEDTNKYTGLTIKVQFDDQEFVSLAQLSGGQKALIALTLIFSIQKYAPAPFYLFDEVDSALDDKYRLAVSKLMNKFCHPSDNSEPAQIIFTTFKEELLDKCDKYFAVKCDHQHSTALEITEKEADKIISEQAENNDHF